MTVGRPLKVEIRAWPAGEYSRPLDSSTTAPRGAWRRSQAIAWRSPGALASSQPSPSNVAARAKPWVFVSTAATPNATSSAAQAATAAAAVHGANRCSAPASTTPAPTPNSSQAWKPNLKTVFIR